MYVNTCEMCSNKTRTEKFKILDDGKFFIGYFAVKTGQYWGKNCKKF